MFITKNDYKIKKLTQTDPDWLMSHDNITVTPRAGVEISDKCPREYKMIIAECMNKGWIKPIAYVKESDYAWEQLTK